MKSEYRGIVAIVLSAIVFVLWYTVFSPPEKTQNIQPPNQNTITEGSTVDVKADVVNNDIVQKAVMPEIIDVQANIPVKESLLRNRFIKAMFTNKGAVPLSWILTSYDEDIEKDGKKVTVPVDLVPAVIGSDPALNVTFTDSNFDVPKNPTYKLIESTERSLTYLWSSKEVDVKKTILLDENSYLADVFIEVFNKTNKALNERSVLTWSGVSVQPKSRGFLGMFQQPVNNQRTPIYFINGSVNRLTNLKKISEQEDLTGSVYWCGLESRYFLSAIIPREQNSQLTAEFGAKQAENKDTFLYSGVALANTIISPKEKAVHKFAVYSGPKEIHQLKAVGIRLDESIDYGWFTIIAKPMLYLLDFFHAIVRNYGVAIILLTIFIKLLLHPINKKSMKSMKQMQALQPRLKELQKKYANDKTRLNTETMQLFKAHKVNPMGGCLPMLLQFPIYIALYKVLWNSIELYRAPFFWFYKDLSAPDPYYITPLLLGVGMFLQQKMMPSATADPMQQKMMMIMPVMFTVFMLFLPVGLVLYILVNTAMSVTQQWMYNHNIRYRDLLKGDFRLLKAAFAKNN